MSETLLGFHRVAQQYGIGLVQPLVTRSVLGTARQRGLAEGQETHTWPLQYQPADNFRGHFEFGLKYERLNFEFFSRLFAGPDGAKIAAEITAWVQNAPTGSYARRAAFFYEWFTGQTLAAPDTAANVGYVDAIDAKQYLVAQTPERVRRWRVNNNLPGLRDCCPLVYLGHEDERAWLYDVTAGVKALDDAYGPELLLRSAAWLTFKERKKRWRCANTTAPEPPSKTGSKCPTKMPTASFARSNSSSGISATNCANHCRRFFRKAGFFTACTRTSSPLCVRRSRAISRPRRPVKQRR